MQENKRIDLPYLEGVLMSIPKHLNSEMFDSPDYVFVKNEHCAVNCHGSLVLVN